MGEKREVPEGFMDPEDEEMDFGKEWTPLITELILKSDELDVEECLCLICAFIAAYGQRHGIHPLELGLKINETFIKSPKVMEMAPGWSNAGS